MLKEERFDHILKVIKATNKASFEELALSLNVSEDTVRRDIEVLAKSGLLVKESAFVSRPCGYVSRR